MPILTGEVAQELGVTRQTVRTFASRFSEHLSTEASAAGKTRYYSDQDLELFKAVKAFRDLNLPYDEIADRIASGEHLVVLREEELKEEPSGRPTEQPTTAMVPFDQFEATVSALVDQWRTIAEERHQEVESLREENRRLREELTTERRSWWQKLLGR